MAELKECIACKHEIPSGASVCTECGNRQDWRRYMVFTSTVLSLLVALVSVLSIGIPWIIQSMKVPKSDLNATIVRTGHGSGRIFDVQVLVTNTGSRPGTMGRTYYRSDKSVWQEMDIPDHWMKESVEIIEPGASGFVYLSRKIPGREIDTPYTLPDKFEVKIETINFDTSRANLFLEYSFESTTLEGSTR